MTFRTKLIIWFVVAIIVCIPNYLLSRTVSPIGKLVKNNKSEIIYGVVNNFIGNNSYAQIFLFIMSLLRRFYSLHFVNFSKLSGNLQI